MHKLIEKLYTFWKKKPNSVVLLITGILAALIGALGTLGGSYIGIIPDLQQKESIFLINIQAKEYPFYDTGIVVQKGDRIQFVVEGSDSFWNCGKGYVSTNGLFDSKMQGLFFSSANLCELIAYLQEGVFYRIGSYEDFLSDSSGLIRLGANDSQGYYSDNEGAIIVKFIIN